MITQAELNAQEIQTVVQQVAQEHLPLKADGYICSSAMIYDVEYSWGAIISVPCPVPISQFVKY
jgi:hypothetical protein